ncbi:MAG: ABC transporter permease [Actinomycetota bacterium]|nr:ABC transporter permease [Actinomycetota bacterium]
MTELAILGDFFSAFEFIFESRESRAGTVQVGGLEEFGQLTLTHLQLSFVSLAIAVAIAVPIGIYLGHLGRFQFLAVSISNVGRAVPVLALIAFFIAFVGVGFTNVALVLVLLAIPPILTNAYVGTAQVDPDTVDSARGMGFSEAQVLTRIELPIALPTIFGGIRTSAVNVVATATIAPYANVETLGIPIINFNVYGGTGQLAAAIVVALITLACDAGLGGVQRAVTPKGLKLAANPSGAPKRRLFGLIPRRSVQPS